MKIVLGLGLSCLLISTIDATMSVKFHTRSWQPDELFKDVSRTEFLFTNEQERFERYENLWQGICSEFDASELKKEIYRRELLKTDDAKKYIELWSSDERRHTDGFAILIEILLGIPEEETRRKLSERDHDFSLINEHIVDEFSLLTVIAFDEIATCRGYTRDKDFYESFGHPAFVTWIKATIADEVTHATNAVRVIHEHHAHRLADLDVVLNKWIESASHHEEYRGTFLMDSLDLGYYKTDFPDFSETLQRLFTQPELLRNASGKSVNF
jgi:hypothetical protein